MLKPKFNKGDKVKITNHRHEYFLQQGIITDFRKIPSEDMYVYLVEMGSIVGVATLKLHEPEIELEVREFVN